MKVKEPLFEYISPDISYNVINGDSLKVLKGIEDGKFDLIITSPPYNVGKSYETKTSIKSRTSLIFCFQYLTGEMRRI